MALHIDGGVYALAHAKHLPPSLHGWIPEISNCSKTAVAMRLHMGLGYAHSALVAQDPSDILPHGS